jgi:L-ribulokinase
MLLGMTLATRPEEIYRALIEATAFGTRVIIEAFENNNVPVNALVACGGLPEKNKLMMQIFSDVTGREMRVSASQQTPALVLRCLGHWRESCRRLPSILGGKQYGTRRMVIYPFQKMPVYDLLFAVSARLWARKNNVMKALKHIAQENRVVERKQLWKNQQFTLHRGLIMKCNFCSGRAVYRYF